jgi:geranylgeranyl pyrophosphate synthase
MGKAYSLRDKAFFDNQLHEFLRANSFTEEIKEILSYALFLGGGGKRLRPRMVIALHLDLFKPQQGINFQFPKPVLSSAIALELIHVATLIHDDLPCLDDDDYRRGALSVHKRFGDGKALLVGDFLFSYAPLFASKEGASPYFIEILCGSSAHVAVGQLLEFSDLTDLERVNVLKTGSLFVAACLLGGKKDYREYLERIGISIGEIFQLKDNLEDDIVLDKNNLSRTITNKINILNNLLDDFEKSIEMSIPNFRSILSEIDQELRV